MKWTRLNEILLFLLVFAIGFQKVELFGLKLVDFLIILVFILILIRGKLLVIPGLNTVLFLLMMLVLASIIFSINTTWSIGEAIRYALCFMMLADLLSLYHQAERRQIEVIIRAGITYFVFSLVCAVLAWRGILPSTLVFTEWDFRLEAFFFDPNFMSIFALFLVVLLNYEYSRIRPAWYVLGMATLVLVILLSRSRTSIALLVLMYFLSFILFNKLKRRSLFLVVVLVSGVVVLLSMSQLFTDIVARYTYRPEGNVPDVRFTIWSYGLDAFWKNPFGYGAGTYRFVMDNYGDYHDAHNTLLTWAVGQGIQFVAVIVFAAVFYFLFRKGSKRRRRFEFTAVLLLVATSLTFDMDTFRASWLMISLIVYKHLQESRPDCRLQVC
jgi:O-antigen ligase